VSLRAVIRRALGRSSARSSAEQRFGHYFDRLDRGSVAVDCGANVGRFTQLMADAGATVYAFEPHPAAYELLAARFAGYDNVTCIRKAISTTSGTVRLYLHVDSEDDPVKWSVATSSIADKGNVDPERYFDADTVDLDAFLREVGPVALLKMDVEGAEIEILERLLETGRIREIGTLLVEMHDARIPPLAERGARLRQRLEGLGNVRLDWE
jgi:FkbM family methyltransferase